MKIISILSLILFSTTLYAQGGMGKLQRDDVVMLSQTVRDSLSDEMFARIEDLKRYALANNLDSAAPLIACKDTSKKWSRACSLSNHDDAEHVKDVVEKFKKMYTEFPDNMHQEYFAVFKSKDSPAGQMMHYQINIMKGSKKRMVSFHYFPVADKLLYGEAN
jgi:hypothetical protein